MNIVILAAGQGKRMRSALPKVLHPLAGRPMLAHVLALARAVRAQAGGDGRIVVVIGHGAQAVRSAFKHEADVQFVLQEPQLGTGHAVQQAVPWLDEATPTLVLYGDVPLLRAQTVMRLLQAACAAGRAGVGLLTARLEEPHGYGRIVRDEAGHVRRIVEERDASAEERLITEVNTGILVAPTPALKRWLACLSADNAQGEYYLTDVVTRAVAEGAPVAAVLIQDTEEALGVNSPLQLARLERILQRRLAEQLLDAGVRLADPARIDVRGELTVGTDVVIDVGNVFEGRVHLGDGVRIGPHNLIRDCTIGAGTEVLGYCYLERATIGARARIGPFARTRPEVTLADEVHIGNFVEVKNSSFGHASKANHLAYIGDATVGARVNIGAGTIVANYDGANKHHTVIEDDVHTGSNSVLVAPITVGAGATVAAGSTVSRHVPAGKLTVARVRQTTVEGWQRPTKKSSN
ncbi:MAG: bifunctional UDP-N-acetylglucosamine diphosphorylase/glucosamine-1-phosphate N-acetyltransferase GlmU [Sutterellaceae bacterium]|nr:bifunctional UDP-N-acetylglucosamine diphosphorylase/glucosamine-1-phosphate N-acetyltransferase GlmU [Burkholderiaceae bacterium]MDW8429709.1 bifunctional UDP-N-acetylglucosamine diphosphorylase/glucosamine-1-phosphate N-acetyltransferase GlmU [Sutterellaceae bacterium]